jgi:hypothetical protein
LICEVTEMSGVKIEQKVVRIAPPGDWGMNISELNTYLSAGWTVKFIQTIGPAGYTDYVIERHL